MQNVQLARRVVSRIEASPDRFRMRYWAVPYSAFPPPSRYTACLAGHTLLESGYKIIARNEFCYPGGRPVANPGNEAAALLGLTKDECRRGIHWWRCHPFCENMPEDAALDNFLKMVFEEEERRLARS